MLHSGCTVLPDLSHSRDQSWLVVANISPLTMTVVTSALPSLTNLLRSTDFLKGCLHCLYLGLNPDLLVVSGAHLVVDEVLVFPADSPHHVVTVLLRHDPQSLPGGLFLTLLDIFSFFESNK